MRAFNRALVLAVLLQLPSLTSAQDTPGDSSDKYAHEKRESERDVAIHLGGLGMKQFGPRVRTAAILIACGKPGIANSIDPSAYEKVKFFVDELGRVRSGSGKDAETIRKMTVDEEFNLAQTESDELGAYEFGYQQAVELIKGTSSFNTVCDTGVKVVDEIPKELKEHPPPSSK